MNQSEKHEKTQRLLHERNRLDWRIQELIEEKDEADKAYREALKDEQSTCKHEDWQSEWHTGWCRTCLVHD